MLSLIAGEDVVVIRLTKRLDDLGEPVGVIEEREIVSDVVVAPGPTKSLDATRPNGVAVYYSLYLPKSFERDVKGCHVEVRGRDYIVVGDPQRYTASNVPGNHNLVVEVTRIDG